MRSVSEQFLDTIRGAHRTRTIVDAYYGGLPVGQDLPLVDGSISADRGSNVRRTASLTFAGSVFPTAPDAPLSPYGSRLRIRRALVYGDGAEEVVTLGWYRVDSASRSSHLDSVSVEASDLSALLVDAQFLTPYTVPTTVPVATTVAALVTAAVPDAPVTVNVSRTLDRPGAATYDSDRAAAIAELATSIGAELYANADGGFTLADVPDLDTTPPVWSVDTGSRGVRVSMSRQQTRENVTNGIVIRAEDSSGDSGVWQHVETDDDPKSPTWWEGPFGKVPKFYSSPSITTVDQAAAAGASLLRESLGLSRSLDLGLVPNFALEPGDVIAVENDDGIIESHLLETLSIPLSPGGDMTASTRAKTYWLQP